MKTNIIKIVTVISIALFSNELSGQNENNVSAVNDSSYVSLAVNFISDAVFFGRKDSISAPYLYPSLTYNHKSGLYTSGSFSYLTKSDQNRIDLFLISGGYQFTSKKFDGDISLTKYFFNDDSYNVISEVEADISGLFSYDFEVLNLALASSMYFNSNSSSDFLLALEASHDFVSNNEKFQISPTSGIYLGSQNFYEQYYINNRFGNGQRQGKGQGNSGTGDVTTTNIIMDESKKFKVLAIELSMPMWYVHESLIFTFLPAYVFPQNPSTLTVDTEVYEEDLKDIFYFVLGVSYRF